MIWSVWQILNEIVTPVGKEWDFFKMIKNIFQLRHLSPEMLTFLKWWYQVKSNPCPPERAIPYQFWSFQRASYLIDLFAESNSEHLTLFWGLSVFNSLHHSFIPGTTDLEWLRWHELWVLLIKRWKYEIVGCWQPLLWLRIINWRNPMIINFNNTSTSMIINPASQTWLIENKIWRKWS